MIPCDRFRDKIFDFVDQELDGTAKEEVQQHIDNCPLCAKFYQGLRSLKQGLKQMKPVEAPDSFQIVLRERIRHEMANKKGFGISPSPVQRWIPAIILLSILVLAAGIYFYPYKQSAVREKFTPIVNTVSDNVDFNRIQYVIDDLGHNSFSSITQDDAIPMSRIDSLLSDEPTTAIADLYQPVRF